jgi:hypothetical protein
MKTAHWFHTLRELQNWAAYLADSTVLVEVIPNATGGWTAITEEKGREG